MQNLSDVKTAACILALLCSAVFWTGCSDDGPELGEFYENEYTDVLTVPVLSDTTAVVLERSIQDLTIVDEQPTFNVQTDPGLQDSLRLTLRVKGGQYDHVPGPSSAHTKILTRGNTLRVWYSVHSRPNNVEIVSPKEPPSGSSKTSPVPPYRSVIDVMIEMPPGAAVAFESVIVRPL